MTHTLIGTGAGWRCSKCGLAWDQDEDAAHDPCDPVAGHPFDGSDHPKYDASSIQWPPTDMISPPPTDRLRANSITVSYIPPASHAAAKIIDPMLRQTGGSHYKNLAIQPTTFCMRNNLDFCIGSVLKYLSRHRRKNGREDLQKAVHFIEIRQAFPYDIRPAGPQRITMLEYVTRNSIDALDAEALYRLEGYYGSVAEPGTYEHGRAAARVIEEINRLITITY